MGDTHLTSHHKNRCNNRPQTVEANHLLQIFSFPEINLEPSEIPPRLNSAILPKQLVAPLTRKNPYIDSFQPYTSIKNPLEVSVNRTAQRQINALLTHDENTQDRRLKSLLNSEIMAGLNKLGISLTGNADRGYCLVGNETGKKLYLPEASIRYANIHLHNEKNIFNVMDNTRKGFFRCKDIDLGRIRSLLETLYRTNTPQSLLNTLTPLVNRYFLLGGNPASVAQHFDPEIQPIVRAAAKELQIPLRDVSQIRKPKILIYTTRSGGGHFAHAQALDQCLKSLGLETVLMDYDRVYYDALAYLTNGATSTSDGFNRVLQRRIGLDGRALESEEEVQKEGKLFDDIIYVLHKLTGATNHFEAARHELKDPNYVALIDNLPSLTGIEGAAISNGLRYIRWPTGPTNVA